MQMFMPETVVFEPGSLQYPLGEKIYKFFITKPVEIVRSPLTAFTRRLTGLTERQRYARSKTILVVTINREKKLDICRPSADYSFKLVSNCPGSCEYCYLQTNQSYKPYMKVFVNLDEIWDTICSYIPEDSDKPVTFEVSSNGDPLAVEHITGSLGETIEFFSKLENGRLRVTTKFDNVDLVTDKKHGGHTRFRVSINTEYIINQFEHRTSLLEERLNAAAKLARADYPLGFIIAPIMIYENWQKEYNLLLQKVYDKLKNENINSLTFELIQHRYTEPAKQRILERFPNTRLDMDDAKRELKWGKYGKFKFVYPKDDARMLNETLSSIIQTYFPNAVIEYFT